MWAGTCPRRAGVSAAAVRPAPDHHGAVKIGRAGVLAATVILAAAACGAKDPWWYTAGKSNCAPPVLIRLDGSVQALGSCAGLLVDQPLTVRVRAGDRLDIHVSQAANGSMIMPFPTADRQGVVKVVARDDHGSAVTYQAVGSGTTDLATDTAFCVDATTGHESQRRCPVLNIIVSK